MTSELHPVQGANPAFCNFTRYLLSDIVDLYVVPQDGATLRGRVCPQIVTTHVNRCTGHSASLEFPKFPVAAYTRYAGNDEEWQSSSVYDPQNCAAFVLQPQNPRTRSRRDKPRSEQCPIYWNLRPVGSAWGSSLEAVGASNACTSRAPLSRSRREQRTEPRLSRFVSHSLDHDEFSLSRSSTSLPGSLLPRLRSFPRETAREAPATPSSPARTLVRGILGRVATKETTTKGLAAIPFCAEGSQIDTAHQVANRTLGSPEETSPIYPKGVCARAGGLPDTQISLTGNDYGQRQSNQAFDEAYPAGNIARGYCRNSSRVCQGKDATHASLAGRSLNRMLSVWNEKAMCQWISWYLLCQQVYLPVSQKFIEHVVPIGLSVSVPRRASAWDARARKLSPESRRALNHSGFGFWGA